MGQRYTVTLAASGGAAPLTWSITGGSAPAGLTLAASGTLSGTPAQVGDSTFTVTVEDAQGQTGTRELTLSVSAPGAPVFTVGQWNLTYFGADSRGPPNSSSGGGTSDDLQLAGARDIMLAAGANLWAMVEMVDTADFDLLKAQLPGFDGFLANNAAFVSGDTSPYGTSSQKVGVLYDSSLTFQSATLVRVGNLSDFADRPPLRVDFTTEINGEETPLTVIVVHMRANSTDPTGPREARQRAAAALKAYLDEQLPTQHVFVLGDWNDDVDESISLDPTSGAPLATPYQTFVSDADRYTFITRELSLAGDDTSIGFENVVDHTLATNEVADRYVPESARVLYVDEGFPDFLNVVSDHRPVVSSYAFSARTGPFLRLKAPHGGTFQGGSTLPITWTAWGVGEVRVEVSTNGGADWSVLATSVPAAQGRFEWSVPDEDASDVRVRVVDAYEPAHSDTSDEALSIVSGPARVIINEVLANEDGQATAHEFVELVNASPFPVDIAGWTVWDATNGSARHVFAPGTRLGEGKAIVVFGGAAGVPTGLTNAVAASSGLLGLGNASDSVRVRRQDATLVDQYDYTSTLAGTSANRSPDATPDAPFVAHDLLPAGLPSSPGLRADGTAF
ncbi:endonuclease/exonuclease/phosphatase family protein [Corallococcus macrosporus]|uniref:Endonuclease/exonuclease/phosphatase family protein n=1 Tax=Myxococcus fulvus (strain ATCC BAA-855 / HW-1) TaxID=483219 RepID=F8CIQ1_MYXFH|nr:endonuclease/exonuclease/phosphatase family protein [Corallococcus macrosporus]